MKKAGIFEFFEWGGFGDENIERKELISIALKKAKDFNFESNQDSSFVVGDTPRDMLLKSSR